MGQPLSDALFRDNTLVAARTPVAPGGRGSMGQRISPLDSTPVAIRGLVQEMDGAEILEAQARGVSASHLVVYRISDFDAAFPREPGTSVDDVLKPDSEIASDGRRLNVAHVRRQRGMVVEVECRERA